MWPPGDVGDIEGALELSVVEVGVGCDDGAVEGLGPPGPPAPPGPDGDEAGDGETVGMLVLSPVGVSVPALLGAKLGGGVLPGGVGWPGPPGPEGRSGEGSVDSGAGVVGAGSAGCCCEGDGPETGGAPLSTAATAEALPRTDWLLKDSRNAPSFPSYKLNPSLVSSVDSTNASIKNTTVSLD